MMEHTSPILGDILTINKKEEHELPFRRTMVRQQSEQQLPHRNFSNFQNKLLSFLKNNQVHVKSATKQLEKLGIKGNELFLKRRSHPTITSKDKKRKSIKQYMSQLSLEKRKKYENHTQEEPIEQKKSHSVLIVKHQKKGSLEIQPKIPIHHTQVHFFQRQKIKSQSAERSESQILSIGNSTSLSRKEEKCINLKESDLERVQSMSIYSDHAHKISLWAGKEINFIKRRKKICINKSRNARQTDSREENGEGEIGPWQRRVTFDMDLP